MTVVLISNDWVKLISKGWAMCWQATPQGSD